MLEPDLLYSVLCDEVRREENGKWILLGLFEQIAVAQFPAQHPGCCIMNKWCNGEGVWTQQTRFVDANDQVLVAGDVISFELPAIESHFTSVQIFGGIPIPAPGRIWVEILLNGELKQRYAFHVLATPPLPPN